MRLITGTMIRRIRAEDYPLPEKKEKKVAIGKKARAKPVTSGRRRP